MEKIGKKLTCFVNIICIYIYIIIYLEIGKDMIVLTNLSSDQEGNGHVHQKTHGR